MNLEDALKYIKNYNLNVKIMEVCGTHTSAIIKNGIRSFLPTNIKLVSGPGCPVCVTPTSYIDKLLEFSYGENNCVVSFGDLFKVRGKDKTFIEASSEGANFKVIYNPLDVIELAVNNPNINYVVAAVGFETTAPIYGIILDKLIKLNIKNVKLHTAIKTMVPALNFICSQEEIDGFICPGHASILIGSNAYTELCNTFKKPFVITGFEPEYIIASIYNILKQREKNIYSVENLYKSVVSQNGNEKSLLLIEKYFTEGDGLWRGIGVIENSALYLKDEYSKFDFGSNNLNESVDNLNCHCGDIMLGRIDPNMCPMYGKTCTPMHPIGPCMVSSEGACGVWYTNKER